MSVLDLWLPILLTALATHVYCTLAWMALPHHKPEWRKLPDEDGLQDWVVGQGLPPGQYVFPMTHDTAEMQSEAFLAKRGKCNGTLVLWDSPVSMGAAIGKTIAFFLFAAFAIGYLATMALRPGDAFLPVFRFVTTAALLTHAAGLFPGVFWFPRKVAMDLVDKAVFALLTGLIFAALWPAAA